MSDNAERNNNNNVDTTSRMSDEGLFVSPHEKAAYDYATALLSERPATFLAPIPALVRLRDVVSNPLLDDDDEISLVTPNKGHHALFRALEGLDGLEKEEQILLEKCPWTCSLTEWVVTGTSAGNNEFSSPRQALETLRALGQSVPRRVCQHPFKRNDIVWVCRTCQADETCVLCHACFSQSNHEGHDVAFYHAQAGGCCDCGDPDAWDPAGFCPHHGGDRYYSSAVSPELIARVRGVVTAAADWMVSCIAETAQTAHSRAQVPPPTRLETFFQRSSSRHPAAAARQYTAAHNHDEEASDLQTDDAQYFSPAAASTSKVRGLAPFQPASSVPEALGHLARQGHGLYIVWHADDVHPSQTRMEALRALLGTASYYTDSLLQKVVRALRHFGQLVVWGSLECMSDCSPAQIQLWLDGDPVVSATVGNLVLERVARLQQFGLSCSIMTRLELIQEQRAVALSQWLTAVARSCDPLCQTVAESILPQRHLVPLLQADFSMSARITKGWHALLLTLLAVPTFKSHLAAAYCDTYRTVTAEYARGKGVLERSGYTLSVQFLNRVTFVVDLVQGRDLLGKLGKSLLETLTVALLEPDARLNPNHFVLTHRRYSPCISDLKCVLNVKGMPRLFASHHCTFLEDWLAALSLAQWMDGQSWRTWAQPHVEVEGRGWVGAFNASISLGSLFERLLAWQDDEVSPITQGPLAGPLMNCVQVTAYVLCRGVAPWQVKEVSMYHPKRRSMEPHESCPASLPLSTVARHFGTACAMWSLPLSQVTPFSFHLPLHRFMAACLREVCLRPDYDNADTDAVPTLMRTLHEQVQSPVELNALMCGLMEFPLLVLARSAQVRANLWRRNGPGLNDQVLNYAEPPFCRAMRDADLLVLQYSLLGRTMHLGKEGRVNDVGMAFLVHLWLHRLGLFDFLGLRKAPDEHPAEYRAEVARGLYLGEEDQSLPWTYSPGREAASLWLLLEEALHLWIVLVTELPPIPPKDRKDQTQQAKRRLVREVVHRLASGAKTHSELSEVHHVLSHWDNVLLSEEGKLLNPDDATGAALGTALAEVADRKHSRGKLEPDKWELQREAWDWYDPSFYHISLRSHQTAAEYRPMASSSPPPQQQRSIPAQAFCPQPQPAHSRFIRLRRDVTADATVLAVLYRTLHVHCGSYQPKQGVPLPGGRMAYESDERSETALARVVHLMTLGAFAWRGDSCDDWRNGGGGSLGSVFWNREAPPTLSDWIAASMLSPPEQIMQCSFYRGEETALQLLHRLAVDGGRAPFVAHDRAVRAGAAWLCDFCAEHCVQAAELLHPKTKTSQETSDMKKVKKGGDMEARIRAAKEKAMAKMKAEADKFASLMKMELGEDDEEEEDKEEQTAMDVEADNAAVSTPKRPARQVSFGSVLSSSNSSAASTVDTAERVAATPMETTQDDNNNMIPPRLLKSRPQCIICSDDGRVSSNNEDQSETPPEYSRKSGRRRKSDGGNALAFVGYAQASTVLKGGGGIPPMEGNGLSFRRFVGTHVALCGHAVHSECCESYLATVSHKEDRVVGLRDEFRCPLCQRLSNCLVPFIDVGVDWIDAPSNQQDDTPTKSEWMVVDNTTTSNEKEWTDNNVQTLHDFLTTTPWWIRRHDSSVVWDGQCAFVACQSVTTTEDPPQQTKPHKRRTGRALRKKDLYAAWNAMMRTPRFVRRRLRSRASDDDPQQPQDAVPATIPTPEDSSAGETVVWRRFMDLVSDICYRADGKRLGDEHFHNDFGEFRHYHTERYAYSMAYRAAGQEPLDWPLCVFPNTMTDTQRQELSREKLLSKLLMTMQAFTYSCCCEIYEARRVIRKVTRSSEEAAGLDRGSLESIYSKFGILGTLIGNKLLIMPRPTIDEDGCQPFHGRLGRLRYMGLAVMAAAGALAADLVQLVLPFPLGDASAAATDKPDRAPIAYPLLLGHILTHVVAAMCASCGRARARSDSLELVWPVAFSIRGSFSVAEQNRGTNHVDSVVADCEGFAKLGLVARILQVLLGRMEMDATRNNDIRIAAILRRASSSASRQGSWTKVCVTLLEWAMPKHVASDVVEYDAILADRFHQACAMAAEAACSFLADCGTIMQVLVPGVMARYDHGQAEEPNNNDHLETLEKLLAFFRWEPLLELLDSPLVREMVTNWSEETFKLMSKRAAMSTVPIRRLSKTQGFRAWDWPMVSLQDLVSASDETHAPEKDVKMGKSLPPPEPQDEESTMQIDMATTAAVVREQQTSLVTFSSKKTVPLIGGGCSIVESTLAAKRATTTTRPRVAVIPTSYTDLYAELGTLLPDSEQTAVCLICGEVLNAGGKGECTRHSYKCGAGTGMFFLLQECAGLIMHNGKAAYIHSPYVDSHGETPQYRGRPLNLDLDRYDVLQEVWSAHGIRQQVLAERGSLRQVIISDFY